MAGARLDLVPRSVFQVSGRIDSTWGGNLVDMVRCTKYLEIIDAEKLVTNAGLQGDRVLDGLVEIADRRKQISNVRARGLFAAFTLPSRDTRNALRQKLWDSGLATLASGPSSIRFRLCLNVTADEVDTALQIVDDSLKP